MNNVEEKKERKGASIRERILHDIESGDVSMRPRLYFTLKVGAVALVSLAILATTVLIINFIDFSIRVNNHESLLGFGSRGIGRFAVFFPWYLVAIDIGLIIFLEWLVRQFRFGYKIPVLYLLAALLLSTAVLGFALDRGTPFNDRMSEHRGRLPSPVRDFYEGARRPPPLESGICRCVVLAIDGNVLLVEETRDGTSTVKVILPSNDPRATTTNLNVGDIVYIAGERENGIIEAFGVRPVGHRGMLLHEMQFSH